jgi:4-hydroxy-tetrahydrodipicolinate synthase
MKQQKVSLTHTHLHSRLPADTAIASFLLRYFHKSSKPLLIAIGGPGGGGKTTFAEKLQRRLKECGIIHLDNYKTSRSERQLRHLAGPHPEANRMDLVCEHLTAIKNGNNVTLPVYDTTTGDTLLFEKYHPSRFNIVEGEIATYKEFRDCIDCSIFIDSDLRTQLAARTGRDIEILGHSFKKAITTFLTSNLTDYTVYGAESKQWSDIHLFCHNDYHVTIESVRAPLLRDFHDAVKDISVIHPTGLIVPVATPFETDLSICQPAYISHLSWLAGKGVTRILVGGTTAEFFSLTIAERLTLLKLAREYFPGLIIFNISGDSIATTIELAKRAQRYGADAAICLPPYYYAGAPVMGMIRYFSFVAEACALPLFLYNFPKHTGNALSAEILQKVPHAGIKDSSANLSLIEYTASYLLGGDSGIVDAYAAGACGFIPGLPNAFPEVYLSLEQALTHSTLHEAENIQTKITSFKKTLPKISGIVIIKKYLNRILDSYPETVRPPLDATLSASFDTGNKLI